MAESFKQFVTRERKRLSKLEKEARRRLRQAEKDLSEIAHEVTAIFAYESAKKGRTARKSTTKRRGGRRRKPAQRGVRRAAVLKIVGKKGATRGEIIEKLGAKGNKREEQAISNALALMKKAGVIESKDGKYVPA